MQSWAQSAKLPLPVSHDTQAATVLWPRCDCVTCDQCVTQLWQVCKLRKLLVTLCLACTVCTLVERDSLIHEASSSWMLARVRTGLLLWETLLSLEQWSLSTLTGDIELSSWPPAPTAAADSDVLLTKTILLFSIRDRVWMCCGKCDVCVCVDVKWYHN